MKRDMDLVRQILLAVEEFPEPDGWADVSIEGASEEDVSYHVKLLDQAGLLEADDVSGGSAFEWKPSSLTWTGHEFLDAARDDMRWNAAKNSVLSKAGNLSFDLMKEALILLGKGQLAG